MLSRLAGWFAYGVLLLVGFGVSAYLAFSWFVRSGVTAVPDVHGLAQEQAVALIRDQGLEIAVEQAPRYDEDVPENHVILQDPGAGSLVKRGSVVEVITSLGQELVEVPEVKSQALQAAQVTLHAAGLNLGRSFNIYSSFGRPGTVVTQIPSAGSRVAHSSPVDLFLSLEGREETFLMPDLAYRRFDRMEEYFRRRGFRLGSVKFEVYEGIPSGTILRQHPLPGHRLRKHDVISVVVTKTESRAPEQGDAPRL
ncbi:MAG: PASTA domain-containing protein [Acidobacteriota bacterium]|nr:PASTA domain-containing protein [Acidobacteriota bacterium]